MKKNNLFKILGITILGYVLLSWLVPIVVSIFGWKVEASFQIGLTGAASVMVETLSGFANTLVYILLVGGFYAVLDATGVYKNAIESIVNKFKTKECVVLFTVVVLMAIISSITGLELGLFILFPFLISVLLMMGYDKLIAITATFGATIVGMYGSTFAGNFYGVLDGMLQTSAKDNLLAKAILFVLGLGLLIGFMLLYMKKKGMLSFKKGEKKVKSKEKVVGKKKVLKKSESKKDVVKTAKVTEDGEVKKPVWPLLVILGLVFLIFLLGTTTWGTIFKTNWFASAHEAIMGWKVFGFDIVNKLFGGIDALGTWSNPNRFRAYSIIIIFANAILMLVYRVKLSDGFAAFVKGIKEYIVPGLLALIAYSLFVFVFYYPVLGVLTDWITGLTDSFNVATSGIHSMISSVFYPDFYYYSYYVVYSFAQKLNDTAVIGLISIMFTNLYSLVMLIAPTSVLLLVSLSISEVKYTEWIKFIWKFALSLLVVSFIVFTILALV